LLEHVKSKEGKKARGGLNGGGEPGWLTKIIRLGGQRARGPPPLQPAVITVCCSVLTYY